VQGRRKVIVEDVQAALEAMRVTDSAAGSQRQSTATWPLDVGVGMLIRAARPSRDRIAFLAAVTVILRPFIPPCAAGAALSKPCNVASTSAHSS
jgi:hypothetical protein